jgi:hypothetical protein
MSGWVGVEMKQQRWSVGERCGKVDNALVESNSAIGTAVHNHPTFTLPPSPPLPLLHVVV